MNDYEKHVKQERENKAALIQRLKDDIRNCELDIERFYNAGDKLNAMFATGKKEGIVSALDLINFMGAGISDTEKDFFRNSIHGAATADDIEFDDIEFSELTDESDAEFKKALGYPVG